jgi:hypothetical protein
MPLFFSAHLIFIPSGIPENCPHFLVLTKVPQFSGLSDESHLKDFFSYYRLNLGNRAELSSTSRKKALELRIISLNLRA